ncbi:hypothetical protein Aduo_004949 [Ancylostoma duodenale]
MTIFRSPASSAPLNQHFGARTVQQYNEKLFTTKELMESQSYLTKRKQDPIDIVKIVKSANKYNKQGKHDVKSLVHQNIEMALQLNVAMMHFESFAARAFSLKAAYHESKTKNTHICGSFWVAQVHQEIGKFQLPSTGLAYDEQNRRFVTSRSIAQEKEVIMIPYRMMETVKCGGTPLCDENQEHETRNAECSLLHCIQMALFF